MRLHVPGPWISRRAGVVGGDDAAIFGGTAKAVKHFPGGEGDVGDGVAGVAFAAVVGSHDADGEGAFAGENDAGIGADAFEFAGFVGDAEVFGKIARDVAGFGRGKEFEEIVGEVFVEDFAFVELLQEENHFMGRGDVFATFG